MDWNVDNVVKLLTLVIALFSLYLANNKRPRVEAFFTHAASHKFFNNNINTHSLVLRNSGSTSAKNVHIIHEYLPDEISVEVYPPMGFERNKLDKDRGELVFESLVTKKQITISYMYPPDITYQKIGLHAESDEGLAHIFPINFVRVFPKWVYILIGYFMFIGFVVTTFLLAKLIVPLFF